jgi:hypothetical protein
MEKPINGKQQVIKRTDEIKEEKLILKVQKDSIIE